MLFILVWTCDVITEVLKRGVLIFGYGLLDCWSWFSQLSSSSHLFVLFVDWWCITKTEVNECCLVHGLLVFLLHLDSFYLCHVVQSHVTHEILAACRYILQLKLIYKGNRYTHFEPNRYTTLEPNRYTKQSLSPTFVIFPFQQQSKTQIWTTPTYNLWLQKLLQDTTKNTTTKRPESGQIPTIHSDSFYFLTSLWPHFFSLEQNNS